jgi:DNA polymerase-1
MLVKADFSHIELHVAARLANHDKLLERLDANHDVHRQTAAEVLNVGVDDVTSDQRQLGKTLNFGLLNGISAEAFLAYAESTGGLTLSREDAARYRSEWLSAHKPIADWQRRVGKQGGEIYTHFGRRRLPATKKTQRINFPIQAGTADGFKSALARLWEDRDRFPSAYPVLAIHDEFVVECDEEETDEVSAWLKRTMIDGMEAGTGVRPHVEVTGGRTWAG